LLALVLQFKSDLKKGRTVSARGFAVALQITRLLPATEDGEFRYEIRSTLEQHDRGARESELARN